MMMSLANGVIMRKSEGRIVFYRPVAMECNVDISNKDSPSWKKKKKFKKKSSIHRYCQANLALLARYQCCYYLAFFRVLFVSLFCPAVAVPKEDSNTYITEFSPC